MDILIVDHDANTRAQIKAFCRRTDDLRIVGEANTGQEGLLAAETLQPDLLLIARKLRDTTGLNVLRALPKHVAVIKHCERSCKRVHLPPSRFTKPKPQTPETCTLSKDTSTT